MQGCKLQQTLLQLPDKSLQDLHNTCASLVHLIIIELSRIGEVSIILYRYNPTLLWRCQESTLSAD